MALPDDVLKEGDATRVLLVRETLLAEASRDAPHVVPTKVGDDAHGVRLGVVAPRPSPDPNANAIPPDGPVVMRITIHDAHAEVAP